MSSNTIFWFELGAFTSAIYAEDCIFEDPTIRFRGKKAYGGFCYWHVFSTFVVIYLSTSFYLIVISYLIYMTSILLYSISIDLKGIELQGVAQLVGIMPHDAEVTSSNLFFSLPLGQLLIYIIKKKIKKKGV